MAVATWQDVAVALGRPESAFTPEQQAQITYWIDGIELLIGVRLGDVADLDQEALQYVETEAAAEKVRRGAIGGASAITTAVADGSVTRRYDSGVSSNDVTEEWWALLSPTPVRARSVRLVAYGEA